MLEEVPIKNAILTNEKLINNDLLNQNVEVENKVKIIESKINDLEELSTMNIKNNNVF